MKVNEIFKSIQGEGPGIGEIALFIRLTKCNLKCSFCDSKYSYNDGEEINWKDIVEVIKQENVGLVIWTGGEPSLQIKQIRDVITLTPEIKHDIETNGTNYFSPKYFNRVIISPKKQNINLIALKKFKEFNNVYFKFVVGDLIDFKFWYDSFFMWNNIYFMPQGITKKEIENVSSWLVDKCVEKEINFSTRLHVLLWGNKRGK